MTLLDRAVREQLAPEDIKQAIRDLAPGSHRTRRVTAVTADEKAGSPQLIEAHERTLPVCRACAETTRDLAWEVKRGSTPPPEALAATLDEVERVLDDLGQGGDRHCRDESRAVVATRCSSAFLAQSRRSGVAPRRGSVAGRDPPGGP